MEYDNENLFIFQTRDSTIYQEGRDVVQISEWTDRIYQNTPQGMYTHTYNFSVFIIMSIMECI